MEKEEAKVIINKFNHDFLNSKNNCVHEDGIEFSFNKNNDNDEDIADIDCIIDTTDSYSKKLLLIVYPNEQYFEKSYVYYEFGEDLGIYINHCVYTSDNIDSYHHYRIWSNKYGKFSDDEVVGMLQNPKITLDDIIYTLCINLIGDEETKYNINKVIIN